MKVYKLFRQDMTTQMSNHVWLVGQRIDLYYGGEGGCTSGVIHYYESPEMAALISPIHVGSDYNRLFECGVEHPIGSDGVKHWAKDIQLIQEIKLPVFDIEQRVKFAVLCAMEVCVLPTFISWANRWLSGEDQTACAAANAARAARAAANAAATYAARAAANAAAIYAARAAIYAARAAYAADKPLNFTKIIAKL